MQHIAILWVVTQGLVAFGHLAVDVCDIWLRSSARELALRSRTGAKISDMIDFGHASYPPFVTCQKCGSLVQVPEVWLCLIADETDRVAEHFANEGSPPTCHEN
jgi:hypothetical protein